MKIATLAVIVQDGKLLLGEKKKGEIGTGKLSGPGGKLDQRETLKECLVRETREELKIELNPASLELMAVIDFCVESEIDFRVYVYRAHILSGQLVETDDMIPDWYPIDNLPFERMYDADRHWLPQFIQGKKFRANVYYQSRAQDFNSIEFFPF